MASPYPTRRHHPRFLPLLIVGVALLLLGCRTERTRWLHPVVRLTVPGAGGTGTIIARTGREHLVLTACHVVRPRRCGIVCIPGLRGSATQPSPTYAPVRVDAFGPDQWGQPARVLRVSPELDLALVRVAFAVARPVMRISPCGPRQGDPVVAIGCVGGMRPWWSTGFIVGPGYEPFPCGAWGINAPIASGCSGGPVVDAHTGELVGVVTGGLLMRTRSGGFVPVPAVGAMVPSTAVRRWLDQP